MPGVDGIEATRRIAAFSLSSFEAPVRLLCRTAASAAAGPDRACPCVEALDSRPQLRQRDQADAARVDRDGVGVEVIVTRGVQLGGEIGSRGSQRPGRRRPTVHIETALRRSSA